jgi:hypothetical protein
MGASRVGRHHCADAYAGARPARVRSAGRIRSRRDRSRRLLVSVMESRNEKYPLHGPRPSAERRDAARCVG